MKSVSPQCATVVANGAIAATWKEIGEMRKCIPQVCMPETPGHFFKHADDQSVVAVAAMASAMERFEIDPRSHSQWAVIAAPRYMGRLAAANIVKRFAAGGAATVSPHVLAQYSLHSVAGAISVALGIQGPNLGVGGGPQALSDGLLAALTMFRAQSVPGIWVVLSEWNVEPVFGDQGAPAEDLKCAAIAMALQFRPAQPGEIELSLRQHPFASSSLECKFAIGRSTVAALAAFLATEQLAENCWQCPLPSGGVFEVVRRSAECAQRRAA